MTALCVQTLNLRKSSALQFSEAAYAQLPPSKDACRGKKFEVSGGVARSSFVAPIRAMEASEATKHANGKSNHSLHNSTGDVFTDDCGGFSGISLSFLFFFPCLVVGIGTLEFLLLSNCV